MAADSISNVVPMKMETLSEQVQQLISHKLGTGGHTLCAQALEKRKRKWRKRQAVNVNSVNEATPIDQHRAELESLVSACWDQQVGLACTRREGLEAAKRLRIEKWDHCLEAIRYRLTQTKLSLENLCEETISSPSTQSPVENILEHPTISELQASIARAKSLQAIKTMKLYETPCIPSLSKKMPHHTSPLKALLQDAVVSQPATSPLKVPPQDAVVSQPATSPLKALLQDAVVSQPATSLLKVPPQDAVVSQPATSLLKVPPQDAVVSQPSTSFLKVLPQDTVVSQTATSLLKVLPQDAVVSQTATSPLKVPPQGAVVSQTATSPLKVPPQDAVVSQTATSPLKVPPQGAVVSQTATSPLKVLPQDVVVSQTATFPLKVLPQDVVVSQTATSPLKALPQDMSVSHEMAITSHTLILSSSLGTDSLPDHIEDTIDCNNNCNIPVVMTTEVSTTSLHPHDTTPPEELLSMPVTFMPPEPTLTPYLTEITTDFQRTSDTPLHVGMEVVCHGESVASSITEDSDVMVESSYVPTLQDANTTPQPSASKKPRIPSSKSRRRSKIGRPKKQHSKGVVKPPSVRSPSPIEENGVVFGDEKKVEHSDTDTDSDSHMRKLLEVLERAPYNLRVPQKNSGDSLRYSFTNGVSVTASAKKKRKKPSTPKQK